MRPTGPSDVATSARRLGGMDVESYAAAGGLHGDAMGCGGHSAEPQSGRGTDSIANYVATCLEPAKSYIT